MLWCSVDGSRFAVGSGRAETGLHNRLYACHDYSSECVVGFAVAGSLCRLGAIFDAWLPGDMHVTRSCAVRAAL